MQYPPINALHSPCDGDHEETDSFQIEYATDDIAVVTYVEDGQQHRVVLSLAA